MRYFILIAGVLLAYLLFVGIAKSAEPPRILTIEECYDETGMMMETAANYMVKEATANRKIENLLEILNEKDTEIVALKESLAKNN